jgi:acyl-CoA ligase (AMP-forming) (exosortase A-associated)
MNFLLHSLLFNQAKIRPDSIAIEYKQEKISYQDLSVLASDFAGGYSNMKLPKGSRVGIFLAKQVETISAIFGTLLAGGSIVPVNPILKANQIEHILCDCDVSILVTSKSRLKQLDDVIENCPALKKIVLVDFDASVNSKQYSKPISSWQDFCQQYNTDNTPTIIESDLAAIFYTSGSTGKPKGVVLTHHNMRVGAESVAQYQNNTEQDRVLAVLPFSFDYGFSQITTALASGATVILLDYLLPKDVIKALERTKATGLAGVPPLWMQITKLAWPESIKDHLRYITNSGGAMPQSTLSILQDKLPNTDIYLMYGLTEAFRSTYLPPNQVNIRPTSMGKAIPNAEIFVINADNEECKPGEEGELVHRGPLVAQGYWNDPAKTSERYKPLPASLTDGRTVTELAVWSGDSVKKDEEGYLYFVSRTDEMIKTSGYRVSPTEVEESLLLLDDISEAVAMGIPHPELGQAILVVATSNSKSEDLVIEITTSLKRQLPAYMLPQKIFIRDELPRNANGKFDRKQMYIEFENIFSN